MAKPPSKAEPFEPKVKETRVWRPFQRRIKVTESLSQKETVHLAGGTALVMAAGLSWMGWPTAPLTTGIAVLLFAVAFIGHELSHKGLARRNGLWAEFRLDPMGALLTIFTLISPFKIIAPGAVVILGETTLGTLGRIAAAGPFFNLILGFLLEGLSRVIPPPFSFVLAGAAYVNGLLAVFNLIPWGILDGRKVLLWSRRVWIILFIGAVALMLLAVF
jgi:Zn-dependent protease